jgi:hypothetical protein
LSGALLAPEDVRPDQINSIVKEVADFFASDKKEFTSVKDSGGASFLGIVISSYTAVNREKLEKAMKDKGWKSSEGGISFWSKGLEVFILSEQTLATESEYTYEITAGNRTLQELSITVSTEKICDPNAL